jgi:hypothetical protein
LPKQPRTQIGFFDSAVMNMHNLASYFPSSFPQNCVCINSSRENFSPPMHVVQIQMWKFKYVGEFYLYLQFLVDASIRTANDFRITPRRIKKFVAGLPRKLQFKGKSVLSVPFIPFGSLKDLTQKFSIFLLTEATFCNCGCPCGIKLLPYGKMFDAAKESDTASLIRLLGDLMREVNPEAEVPPVFVFTTKTCLETQLTTSTLDDPAQINVRDLLSAAGLSVSEGPGEGGCCCACAPDGTGGCASCAKPSKSASSLSSEEGGKLCGTKRKREDENTAACCPGGGVSAVSSASSSEGVMVTTAPPSPKKAKLV